MQTITRKGTFDSAHRVMNEKMKCFNIHGHTYLYELTFGFDKMQPIGYALDFKEIKRVACQWIDDVLDHGVILNPKDEKLIHLSLELHSKIWLMTLNDREYCNPTVENIAKELFLAVHELTDRIYKTKLWLVNVRLYETPNCFTDVTGDDIPVDECKAWWKNNSKSLHKYADEKGTFEYDDRKG